MMMPASNTRRFVTVADLFRLDVSACCGAHGKGFHHVEMTVPDDVNLFMKLVEAMLVRIDADANVYACKTGDLANAALRVMSEDLSTTFENPDEAHVQMKSLIRRVRIVRDAQDRLVRAINAAERFERGERRFVSGESVEDLLARSKRLRAEVDKRLDSIRKRRTVSRAQE